MAFEYCILHISAFVKKEEIKEKEESRQDWDNEGAMKKNEKSQKN